MPSRKQATQFLWILAGLSLAFAAGSLLQSARSPAQRARPNLFPEADLYRNVEQFRDVLEVVNRQYVDAEAASLEKLTQAALSGMLSSLDPHTDFLPAKQFDSLRTETSQEYGGLGIQVELRGGRMTIIAPISGSPADKAGLARGDQILKVNGESIEGLGLDAMIERLRGKPGTTVTVSVFRPSTDSTRDYRIVRRLIETKSVESVQLLDHGIGTVTITNFYEKTGDEFADALGELEKQGMQALILDLRNNPGGLLSAAVEVAGLFFNRGELIVYTQGRDAASRQNLNSRNRSGAKAYPVAILMNSGSASASEIVAGALQDAGKAVIVGETSFGKGLVQSILPLRGGDAIRMTTSQYFTPKGRQIQERGVKPDIELVIPVEEESRVRLWRNRRDLLKADEFEAEYGFAPVEDRQFEAAAAALRGLQLLAGP